MYLCKTASKQAFLSVLVALQSSPIVAAWGQFGHRTIALLSARFMFPETAHHVSSILPKSENIPSAAIWPDYYSHVPEGRWSGPLHYIGGHWDVEEGSENGENGHKCSLNYPVDCDGKAHCVIWGIVNSTSKLLSPYIPPSEEQIEAYERSQQTAISLPLPHAELDAFTEQDKSRKEVESSKNSPTWLSLHHLSLRFLLHFIADIHQPLHTVGYRRGGNGIPILFTGKHSNLHSAWDTLIPVYGFLGNKTGRVSPRDSITWSDALHSRIEGLRRSLSREEWERKFIGKCFANLEFLHSPKELSEDTIQECALEWAREANRQVCSYVFNVPGGADNITDSELTGEQGGFYAENGFKIAEELVMMAGWRLAGWLNFIVTGRTGLGGSGGGGDGVVADFQEEL